MQKYTNVNVLASLVAQMTAHDPADRPSALEALRHLDDIMRSVWSLHRLWRAHPRDEPIISRPSLDMIHLVRRGESLRVDYLITNYRCRSFLLSIDPYSDWYPLHDTLDRMY